MRMTLRSPNDAMSQALKKPLPGIMPVVKRLTQAS